MRSREESQMLRVLRGRKKRKSDIENRIAENEDLLIFKENETEQQNEKMKKSSRYVFSEA